VSENVYRDSRRRRAAREAKWRRVAHLREAMSREEVAEEEVRLQEEVASRIAAGRVTVCPPAAHTQFHENVISFH